MTKPLHASFVTIVEGSTKVSGCRRSSQSGIYVLLCDTSDHLLNHYSQGFRPQFFACLQGKSVGDTRIELFRSEEQAKSQQAATRLIVIRPHTTISVNKDKHSFTVSNSTIVTQSDADLRQWLTKIYQVQPTVKGLSDYSLQIYDG